jgi:DinB superfamily
MSGDGRTAGGPADGYLGRMRAVQARLDAHAALGPPPGLTDPDPGGAERWQAGQVWAHLAEFPPYWAAQIQRVVDGWLDQDPAEASRTPVRFGRTKADPDRIAAIERDRHADPAALLERVRRDVAALADQLEALPPAAWGAVGNHPGLGPMTLPQIVEDFVVGHLEEHADQLDLLRRRAPT